jgi:hypothetical protein
MVFYTSSESAFLCMVYYDRRDVPASLVWEAPYRRGLVRAAQFLQQPAHVATSVFAAVEPLPFWNR